VNPESRVAPAASPSFRGVDGGIFAVKWRKRSLGFLSADDADDRRSEKWSCIGEISGHTTKDRRPLDAQIRERLADAVDDLDEFGMGLLEANDR
jgi:hypothetical protein